MRAAVSGGLPGGRPALADAEAEEVEEEEDLKTRVMSRLGQGFKNPAMGDAMTAYGLQMMGPQFAQQNRGLLSSFGG